MEYQWDLSKIYVKDVGDFSDVVCAFDAKMICKDDDGNFGVYDVFIPVNISNLSADNFISLDNLTREIVKAWADSYFTTEELDTIKNKARERCVIYNCTQINTRLGSQFK